ncbi:MAG TPA: FIST N-terminal domain-containing protein [Actinomycetota bacterium]
MAIGHSDDLDAEDAVEAIVAQCRDTLGDAAPKAGLVFSTYATDPGTLVSKIRERMPGIELIGTTSMAEMSSVLGFQEDSVTLAVFASDTVDITAGMGTNVASDPRAAARRAVEEAKEKTTKEPRLCVALPSVGGHEPAILIEHIREELGGNVGVVGGGSAPATYRDDPMTAHQFHNDRFTSDAVPILLFSGPLVYSLGIDTGWRPVGPRGKVTRSSGRILQEIDGRPAVEFYDRYVGARAEPTPANPLAVFEPGTEDFFLRVPTVFDREDGSITAAGAIPEGTEVQLSVAVTDEIFGGSKSAVEKAIKGFPEGSKPEGALVFSCAIRKLVLGTRTSGEYDIAQDQLGAAVPICGFYSMGEIAPIETGATRYHNETMVAVLVGTE